MAVKTKVTIKGLDNVSKKMMAASKNVNLSDFGEQVKQKMIQIIDDNRVRDIKQPEERFEGKYTKHIKDVLTVVVKKDGIGIGDVETLNKEVPYWKVINDGNYVPPRTRGTFLGGAGSSFFYHADAPYMTPTKSVPAMQYIEKTMTWVKQHAPKEIKKRMIQAFKDFRNTSLIRMRTK